MRLKSTILTCVVLIIGSCSSSKDSHKFYGTLTIKTQDGIEWEIVNYDKLLNLPQNHHLIYVGSYAGLHMIYFQSKVYGPAKYAVSKNEYTPKVEFEYSTLDSTIKKGQFIFRDSLSLLPNQSLKPTTQPPALRVIEIEFSTHDTREK